MRGQHTVPPKKILLAERDEQKGRPAIAEKNALTIHGPVEKDAIGREGRTKGATEK